MIAFRVDPHAVREVLKNFKPPQPCDPVEPGEQECPGWGIFNGNKEIQACDTCNRFESDVEASEYVEAMMRIAEQVVSASRVTPTQGTPPTREEAMLACDRARELLESTGTPRFHGGVDGARAKLNNALQVIIDVHDEPATLLRRAIRLRLRELE